MPKKKQTEKRGGSSTLPASLKAYFESGDCTHETCPKRAETFILASPHKRDEQRQVWKTCRTELLQEWTRKHPCTRPHAWWQHEAPKEPVGPEWDYRRFDAAQRRRIGGVGTPSHEVLCVAPSFEYGLPPSWVSQWEADYYNGRAKDIHGSPMGSEYQDGDFRGAADRSERSVGF